MALPGHGGARRATVLERCLYAAAALFLGYWLWVAGEGWWFQTSFAQRLAVMGVPTGTDQTISKARRARHEARSSGLVGRITIPRVHVSAIVVEGTSNAPLRRGVGHVKGSAFPGERGNVVLAAHRDTYFRGLREIQRGDRVLVATPDGVFDYQVDTVMIVSPRRTDLIVVPKPADQPFQFIVDSVIGRLAASATI